MDLIYISHAHTKNASHIFVIQGGKPASCAYYYLLHEQRASYPYRAQNQRKEAFTHYLVEDVCFFSFF